MILNYDYRNRAHFIKFRTNTFLGGEHILFQINIISERTDKEKQQQ